MRKTCVGIGIAVLMLTAIVGCGMVKSMGKDPSGAELTKLEALPNYKNGTFENLAERSDSTIKSKWLFLHSKPETVRPSRALPWVKTDLKTLADPAPTIVWFGHSSLLIKAAQDNILIDPILVTMPGLCRG